VGGEIVENLVFCCSTGSSYVTSVNVKEVGIPGAEHEQTIKNEIETWWKSSR
jgi:hypothetical protein